ncbi:hypothetical protein EDD17DRAFT_1519496 [Pisolithus thermaeus]|nr:hypothetical protein EDD17DRAFT_1519496 [Pisolithus thermaeus]
MAYGGLIARHSTDPGSSSGPSPRTTVVEYRKDGTVSKMRSHKGNVPILPQTKFCSECPAKFTRTTHLNRHLRTHTGERLHRCDTCEAQFTRSDLLTRHKKTCGDPSHANRTRRRSCQACANSKVKCDLQRPCSKCQARGKECVFVVRPPRSSTVAKMTAAPAIVPEHTARPINGPESKFSAPPISLQPSSPVMSHPTGRQCSYNWNASASDQLESRPEELGVHSDGSSPSPSEAISATSDIGSSPPSDPAAFEPFLSSEIPGYNTVSVGDNSTRETYIPHTPLLSSSAEESLPFTSQAGGVQQRPHHSDTLLYPPSSKDNYIPQYTTAIDVCYQALSEHQHHRHVDSSEHTRSRAKPAGPYSSGGTWRNSCEGLVNNSQFQFNYPAKSAGDAFWIDYANHWSIPPDMVRMAMSDSSRHVDGDGQTSRSHRSEYLADAIRWNGYSVMRRQVTSTDFA